MTIFNQAFCQETSNKRLPNIIIITFSGLRNSESIEDPAHQYMPNFWNTILKEGTLYNNLIEFNYEFHMPAVQAINGGFSSKLFYSRLIHPSIFQYVRKKYKLPKEKLWMVGARNNQDCYFETSEYSRDTFPVTFNLPSSQSPEFVTEIKKILTKQEAIFFDSLVGHYKKQFTGFPHWDAYGKIQFRLSKKIMQEYKPIIVHYVLNDVEVAHYDTFGKYVLALKDSDTWISEIWKMIQEDDFYKDNTYLLITPDHSRDLYYAQHFDNLEDNPSRVWLFVYGPKIKKGLIINREVHHPDIFATVAYIMGVKTHRNEGKILSDCFLNKTK